jgi:hypothetical protein
MQTVTLSANAVAVLRFEIMGWKAKKPATRLPAYRELALAGIMEPVPGSDAEYRFTQEAYARRETILRDEEERIERERYEPPDASNLSVAARALLRRVATGEPVDVTLENRPVFRELAAARIIDLMHTFAKGDESRYRFTYWGWKQRFEILGCEDAEASWHRRGERNLQVRAGDSKDPPPSALSTPSSSLRESAAHDR